MRAPVMAVVYFRFYEELNDFLPPTRHKTTFAYELNRRAAVKDIIEALGVPHTEVELILVNSRSVGFDYIVQSGDRVSVYPMFEAFDITPLIRLRPRPLRTPCFVLDAHLGTLARYLRLIGFNTLYRNDYADAELAATSAVEQRILLTRDRGLLKRRIVVRGYYIRSDQPRRQLEEVCKRFDLYRLIAPYRRCTHCNGQLETIEKRTIIDQLEPKTRRYYTHFLQCETCDQIYWKGSHYKHMQHMIENLKANAPR